MAQRQIATQDIAALGWATIAKSGVAVSLTGSTNETALATITIPGGTLGVNGGIRVICFWSAVGTTTRTQRIRLGGIGGGVLFSNTTSTSTAHKSTTDALNRNATNSQVAMSLCTRGTDSVVVTPSIATTAIDTSVNQDLVITGQLTTGTETITLEGYIVEVLK